MKKVGPPAGEAGGPGARQQEVEVRVWRDGGWGTGPSPAQSQVQSGSWRPGEDLQQRAWDRSGRGNPRARRGVRSHVARAVSTVASSRSISSADDKSNGRANTDFAGCDCVRSDYGPMSRGNETRLAERAIAAAGFVGIVAAACKSYRAAGKVRPRLASAWVSANSTATTWAASATMRA